MTPSEATHYEWIKHVIEMLPEWGIVLTGAKGVGEIPNEQSRYGTAWPGAPRYPHPMKGSVVLGVFKEFDLYLCEQAALPPTLVARHGADGAYTSFNPTLRHDADLKEQHPAIQEAYARAAALGYGAMLGVSRPER
ncbi:hypothetical protein [Pararobbsia silviterrae]|uniref:Uncharacterized protein n=1 Tax=Pararobbsia silviterrae TaxID=1792498 RepID=A0A494X4Z3_9BURK|nr:hypothetical protein [Pararobbsia silviterrae]RKP44751.1 hypothetical protein D7S86_27420 [Pararobbsia silviterrae]